MAKIVSKNDPDTKKVWCKYGKIPGQGDGVNLFFVGENKFFSPFSDDIVNAEKGAKSIISS